MASKKTMVLKRTALSVAFGMCFASSVVFAQSSVGSISGSAKAGATVSIDNVDTGAHREITADSSGHFGFGQLAPGSYKITSDGVTRNVEVRVGTGSNVDLVAAPASTGADLGGVTVVGSNAINPIDVSSVESTTVFTAEQINQLPVGRDPTNVALLAPGTVKGDTGFGNLASFGGSSVAENGYYINGFDVTNIRFFLAYATLPFQAIAEEQVKTGGYGAEFGRSLGGVLNIVTKRGTNEWKGGINVNWAPEALQEHQDNVLSKDPDKLYWAFREDNENENLDYNIWAGGPIVKDRLFFFGLFQGFHDSSDIYGVNNSTHNTDRKPHGLIKLDWNISDNHTLEFTGISNRDSTHTYFYNNDADYSTTHDDFQYDYHTQTGGETYILKYTGYLTDNFTLSAQAGRLKNTNNFVPEAPLPGEDCPSVYDGRSGELLYLGCWPVATFRSVRAIGAPPDTDIRKAFRIDGEWRLGDHLVRFGYDKEKFTSTQAAVDFSGGVYYRYFTTADGSVNGVAGATCAGCDYVRERHFTSSAGSFEIINTAIYLEDSWQITDNVLLYGGLRSESFDNKNSEGVSFVKANNLLAPRIGFSWDVNGDSTLKVFGNAGRYFIPVAANTNIRASAVEYTVGTFHLFTGIDPVTGAPIGKGPGIGVPNETGSPLVPDASTIADTELSPMYQDEFILGLQRDLGNNWTVGARAIYREVKSGMDDYCGHQAFADWAEDNGYDNFDTGTMASCIVINPGKDVNVSLDLESDGNFTVVTVPNSYLGLPKYKRSYSAMEIFWERAKVDNWYLQGSYTFAHSKGNVEGYVNSTLEQGDPGLTQDFDFAAIQLGTYGFLPNDRRHTLKLFGAYEFNDDWRVSANLLVQSGRPINCNGYIPLTGQIPGLGEDASNLGNYAASSFWCIEPDGTSVLHQRGDQGRTPWTKSIDAQLAWTPSFADHKLTLAVNVINLFNFQGVTEYNETHDRDRASPEMDPDYLNISNYQTPRQVRFSATYEF
jgi:hypothetical protein